MFSGPGATVDLSNATCRFAVLPGTPMFKFTKGASRANTTIKLSSSCQPDAKSYMVNSRP